jgi:hypothetical protein
MAILALPVLTYPNVRCAPVLIITIFAAPQRILGQTLRYHASSDHNASAAIVPFKSAQRRMTVSAPASVSASA